MVGLVIPRILNLIKLLANISLSMLMAMVVGVEGEVVLSPLYTLQFIPLFERIFVL